MATNASFGLLSPHHAVSTSHLSDTQRLRAIATLANNRLAEHPHFKGRGGFVRCCVDGRRIVLTGLVPSYHLKQLAQEAVRSVVAPSECENRVTVASPDGECSGVQNASWATIDANSPNKKSGFAKRSLKPR